mmetsp:Transcript_61071/g.126015  ORF Transcript_61071/g.126015 Transcript_61071/m.126015 type:complete len:281 (+) Transcript_61071:1158-2000(+)
MGVALVGEGGTRAPNLSLNRVRGREGDLAREGAVQVHSGGIRSRIVIGVGLVGRLFQLLPHDETGHLVQGEAEAVRQPMRDGGEGDSLAITPPLHSPDSAWDRACRRAPLLGEVEEEALGGTVVRPERCRLEVPHQALGGKHVREDRLDFHGEGEDLLSRKRLHGEEAMSQEWGALILPHLHQFGEGLKVLIELVDLHLRGLASVSKASLDGDHEEDEVGIQAFKGNRSRIGSWEAGLGEAVPLGQIGEVEGKDGLDEAPKLVEETDEALLGDIHHAREG